MRRSVCGKTPTSRRGRDISRDAPAKGCNALVSSSHVPFCGLPPVPAEIWQRWLLDPALLAFLAAVPLLALHAARGRWNHRQWCCFVAGWTVLSLALVSPLCALSVALFSMRATQHMVLLLLAAPLLALARPQRLLGPRQQAALLELERRPAFAAGVALAFAIALWTWHLPPVYEATFRDDRLYWAMHATLLGTALPLWMQLLRQDAGQLLLRALLAFGTFLQMGVLGALLTLSPVLLYSAHVTTTLAWGIEPLADQQLGGLIMWVPGCGMLLLAVLAILHRGLLDGQGRTLRRVS